MKSIKMILPMALLAVFQSAGAETNTIKLKDDFFGKCLSRNIGANNVAPQIANSFCSCQWNAVSTKLTAQEIANLNSLTTSSSAPIKFPGSEKVIPDIKACKAAAEH